MKVAEIRTAFKKLDNTSKNNYQTISALSNFAKLFESIIYSQLNNYMEANSLNTSLAFVRIIIHKTSS